MSEVITIGEPMVVFIPHKAGSFAEVDCFSKGIAGAELNVAVGIARLGHSVSYISRLGKDILGEYIWQFIKKEGIDTSLLQMEEEHLTGCYFKTKVLEGNPEVFYLRKNSAASYLKKEDMEPLSFAGAKILHLTGITAAISKNCMEACCQAVEKAREQQMQVFFDPNIRAPLWRSESEMRECLNSMAALADVVMPGLREGEILTGRRDKEQIADFYLKCGVKTVIIKNGEKGAYCKSQGEKGYDVAGFPAGRVVDTVGAGDAFAAGVITGILEDLSLPETIKRGNAMGALALTSAGDNESMPDRKKLLDFIEKGGRYECVG